MQKLLPSRCQLHLWDVRCILICHTGLWRSLNYSLIRCISVAEWQMYTILTDVIPLVVFLTYWSLLPTCTKWLSLHDNRCTGALLLQCRCSCVCNKRKNQLGLCNNCGQYSISSHMDNIQYVLYIKTKLLRMFHLPHVFYPPQPTPHWTDLPLMTSQKLQTHLIHYLSLLLTD